MTSARVLVLLCVLFAALGISSEMVDAREVAKKTQENTKKEESANPTIDSYHDGDGHHRRYPTYHPPPQPNPHYQPPKYHPPKYQPPKYHPPKCRKCCFKGYCKCCSSPDEIPDAAEIMPETHN